MRLLCPLIASALALGIVIPANAQVSVNLKALDSLGASEGARSHHAVPQVTKRPLARAPDAALPLPPSPLPAPVPAPAEVSPGGASSRLAAGGIGPLPAPPPEHPPAPPVIAPIVLVGPPHPEPMPPPPVVSTSAPGSAYPIKQGVRVTFGSSGAALNPATLDALKRLAAEAHARHASSVSVDAFAPDDPSDPSTPRRLSLTRALAARAIFREAGIPSEKIYVRVSVAAPHTKEPPNRVDVTLAEAPKATR